jgi:hypothetical protein
LKITIAIDPASAGCSVNNFAFEAAIYLSGLKAGFYAK